MQTSEDQNQNITAPSPTPADSRLWTKYNTVTSVLAALSIVVAIYFGVKNSEIAKQSAMVAEHSAKTASENLQLNQEIARKNEPAVLVDARINPKSELIFQTPDVLESRGGVIHKALSRYLFAQGVIGGAVGKALVKYGVISEEQLVVSTAKLSEGGEQWLGSKIRIPMDIHLKNNGNKDTTLVKLQLEFASMNGGTVTYTANEFKSILLAANRVIDRGAEQLDGIWIPYMDFLFSELPLFMGVNTEEAEAVLKLLTEQDPKTASGMINPKKPAKLLFTDQHGVISSVEFQASDIAELLKKAASID